MQKETDDSRSRAAREAELSEVLASYVEPRLVSYSFVVAFVVVGLLLCVSVAWAASQHQRAEPFRLQDAPPEEFERGVSAYRRGEWDEALRLMQQARAQAVRPHPRVEDYVQRLERIHRDGERLSRAEEALAADEPERAIKLAALISPNSPLFPQAELLERNARARLVPKAPPQVPAASTNAAPTENAAATNETPARSQRPHAKRPVYVIHDPKPVDFDHEW